MQETQFQSILLSRSPGVGNSNPLQYSCLGNPMDRGAWWATVHGIAKSQARLSTCMCVCVCVCVTESLCCTAVINTTLQINYAIKKRLWRLWNKERSIEGATGLCPQKAEHMFCTERLECPLFRTSAGDKRENFQGWSNMVPDMAEVSARWAGVRWRPSGRTRRPEPPGPLGREIWNSVTKQGQTPAPNTTGIVT